MSELLLQWLNKDIGLSRKVKSFEVDFSNGYLFGELLQRHGLLSDADFSDSFTDAFNLAAKNQNMSKLKAAFSSGSATSLGVKFNDEQIHHIMDEDRGASLRLLFQLRKKFAETPGSLKPQHRRDTKPPLVREKKGQDEERFFETTLTKMPRQAPRAVYEIHNKAFVDEHTRQMQKTVDDEAAEDAATKQRQSDFRSSRRKVMQTHKDRVVEINISNEENWQANMRRKHGNVEKDLNFEKKTLQREIDKIHAIRAKHEDDCGYQEDAESQGIGWFEKNLQRIGIDTSEHSGRHDATIVASNAKEFYDQMKEQQQDPGKLKVECTLRMKKIKDQKKASDVAQRERDRRLRRQIVDQQEKQREVEVQRQEEDLLRWLQEESVKYRKEAVVHDLNARYKAAQQSQRQSNQEAYAVKAEQQMEEAWGKFAEKCREERAAKLAERQFEREKAAMRGAAGLDALERPEEASSDEGEDPGADPFTTQRPAQPDSPIDEPIASPTPSKRSAPQSPEPASAGADAKVAPAASLVAAVLDPQTSEYLSMRGSWGAHRLSRKQVHTWLDEVLPTQSERAFPSTSAEDESRLGGIVRWLFEPEEAQLESVQLPDDFLPILAMTGNPIKCGDADASLKASQNICSKLGLGLVVPQKAIEECVSLAKESREETQEPEWPPLARMRELGHSFIEHSTERPSSPMPCPLLAEMVFRKIETLLEQPPPKEEELDPKAKSKAKAKAKSKGKAEEEEPPWTRPKAILLLSSPTEFSQGSSLEPTLQRFLAPSLRIENSETDLQAQLSAMIAPWEFDAQDVASKPGLPRAVGEKAPVRLLRLRQDDHEKLCSQVTSEAPNQQAGPRRNSETTDAIAMRRASKETLTATPAAGEGEESQSFGFLWLNEDAQVFIEKPDDPVEPEQDAVPANPDEGQEEVDPEVAALMRAEAELCRQVADIVNGLRRRTPPKDEAEEGQQSEAIGENEETADEGAVEADPISETSVNQIGPPWLSMPGDTREEIRLSWLEGLSEYMTNLNSAVGDVHAEAVEFGQKLREMQRGFLEFLQRTDEKNSAMTEYLQAWPQRSFRRHPDDVNEEVEELSDHLWQFANRRRAESIDELARLVECGFWEKRATASLDLVVRLYSIECNHFTKIAALFFSSYGQLWSGTNDWDEVFDADTQGLSSLNDFVAWIQNVTRNIANAPLPLPISNAEELSGDFAGDDDQEQQRVGHHAELQGAIAAEKVKLLQRLRMVEAWSIARLNMMRGQLDEVFRRMDDWIRDRVCAENEAIKQAIAQLQDGLWVTDEVGKPKTPTRSPSRSSVSSPSKKMPKSASATEVHHRKKRRDCLKALEPKTLDVEVLQAPPLEVTSVPPVAQETLRGRCSAASPCLLQELSAVSKGQPEEKQPNVVLWLQT